MSLQLHVFGPGVDERRRLEPGEPALIVGRDSDCAIWRFLRPWATSDVGLPEPSVA